MKTVAIIPAGGAGTRLNGEAAKQYLTLGGVPIIVHTLSVFNNLRAVDEIFLVLPSDDISMHGWRLVERYGLSKVTRILPGGKYRQDSVKNGIEALGKDCGLVVIHDGVRPFVSAELIETAIITGADAEAVTLGIPVIDTVKSTGASGFVTKTLNREKLWLTQTPQVFSAPLIIDAYRRAYKDGYYGTDDSVLVERLGVKVKMLPGSTENIKITTRSDLSWGEFYLKTRNQSL